VFADLDSHPFHHISLFFNSLDDSRRFYPRIYLRLGSSIRRMESYRSSLSDASDALARQTVATHLIRSLER
jgi:hypothetical protein